jgi:hypothetical protein
MIEWLIRHFKIEAYFVSIGIRPLSTFVLPAQIGQINFSRLSSDLQQQAVFNADIPMAKCLYSSDSHDRQ